MKLSIRYLLNYNNPNSYTPADQLEFAAGDTVTVYFELVDLSQNQYGDPPGIVYIASPSPTRVLTVTVQNNNDALVLVKVPTQVAGTPFWTMNFASGEIAGGTYSLKLLLVEGSKLTNSNINASVLVDPADAFPPGGYWPAGSGGFNGSTN